jgi:hypothetical protein
MPRPEPCPHPYPRKLTFEIAAEVRRLRREGMAATEIARRYGVAKSSISAVLKMHVYVPEGVIAVGLEHHERALLRELAEELKVSDEQLAAELVVKGLERRILRQG